MSDYDMTRAAWMRNQQRFREAAQGRWHWPLLDLESYDRRSDLYGAERGALGELAACFYGGRAREAYALLRAATLIPAALTRLTVPLCDALDIAGAVTLYRHMTLRLLLLETHRRQTGYWGWTSADWSEILCSDSEQFRKRHQVHRECRRQVIAAGYLLGSPTDVCLLPVDLHALAAALFGKDSVALGVQQVKQEYAKQQEAPLLPQFVALSLGQSPLRKGRTVVKVEQRELPAFERDDLRLLYLLLLSNHSPLLQDLDYACLSDLYQKHPAQSSRQHLIQLSATLARLGVIERVLPCGIHVEWIDWCRRWYKTSSRPEEIRGSYFGFLLRVGCWLAQHYPDVTQPRQWTRMHTQAFVREVFGVEGSALASKGVGPDHAGENDFAWGTKIQYLQILRTFFRDCGQWGWFQVQIDPGPPFWSRKAASSAGERQHLFFFEND